MAEGENVKKVEWKEWKVDEIVLKVEFDGEHLVLWR